MPIHFGVVLGCKGGGGKKKPFRSRKVFSGAGISNRAIGQIFHHARAWKFIFGEVFWFRRPKQSSTGKTSQGQPWRSDGLQWVWLVSGSRCRRQRCWPCEGSMPCGAGDLLASCVLASCFHISINNVWYIDTR